MSQDSKKELKRTTRNARKHAGEKNILKIYLKDLSVEYEQKKSNERTKMQTKHGKPWINIGIAFPWMKQEMFV